MHHAGSISGVDPRTGEDIGDPIPVTTEAELFEVLADAYAATAEFGRSTPAVRADLLVALADRLELHAARLIALASAETGLSEERLTGELARTAGQLRLFADAVLDGAYLDVTWDQPRDNTSPPQPDLRSWMEPRGVVLVFAASNFPLAFSVLGGDTASALAVGCPVVVKAHNSHPGLSLAVAQLVSDTVTELGFPPGVFAVVFGRNAGVQALTDTRVSAAGFTGSAFGGLTLERLAQARPIPIPFYGELGSVNPVVVTPGAVTTRGAEIVSGFVASMTLGVGQFCTKPGLLFLPVGHGLDSVLEALITEVAPGAMLNARVHTQFEDGVRDLAANDDVELLATSASAPPTGGSWAAASLFRTTAAKFMTAYDALSRECFGPSALIVEYGDSAELLAALALVEGSLTGTLHEQTAANSDVGFPVSAVVELLRGKVGRLVFNGWPTGVAVTWAMHHGGPRPATTDAAYTSVGVASVRRWLRPVCYQSSPEALLPQGLRADNPWQLPRRVNGRPEDRPS